LISNALVLLTWQRSKLPQKSQGISCHKKKNAPLAFCKGERALKGQPSRTLFIYPRPFLGDIPEVDARTKDQRQKKPGYTAREPFFSKETSFDMTSVFLFPPN
jgi:hypothetical protein